MHQKEGYFKKEAFKNIKISLCDLFLIAYFFINETLISNRSYFTGISTRTILDYYGLFRNVMSFRLLNLYIFLGGNQRVVHINEICALRIKYNRGIFKPQIWLLGGIDIITKKAFLVIVPDRTRQTLFNIVFDKVLPGIKINTDCFRSYRTISTLMDSDGNNFYSHSDNFVYPITNTHTTNIECVFSQFRQFFNKCSRNRFYLGAYNDEFLYRWNFLTENNN